MGKILLSVPPTLFILGVLGNGVMYLPHTIHTNFTPTPAFLYSKTSGYNQTLKNIQISYIHHHTYYDYYAVPLYDLLNK